MLDILVQSRRNAKSAKRFLRKLRKDPQYVPRVIVTDKLRSYRTSALFSSRSPRSVKKRPLTPLSARRQPAASTAVSPRSR